MSDVGAGLLAHLQQDRPTCVVPLLHGESGEDGALREVLELLELPYVGSRPSACRLAFDKPVAQTLVGRAGCTPLPARTLPAEAFRELGAAAVMTAMVETVGLPMMVARPRRLRAGLQPGDRRRPAAGGDGPRVLLRRHRAGRDVRRGT